MKANTDPRRVIIMEPLSRATITCLVAPPAGAPAAHEMRGLLRVLVAGGILTAALATTGLAVAATSGVSASPVEPATLEVSRGTVSFDVATNVGVLKVHGESKTLQGRARVREGPAGMVLEQLQASVPVNALKTGISLRDEHMRKRVFTTSTGEAPDLGFVASAATCSPGEGGRETVCSAAGELTIRGTTRPFSILLKVSEKNGVFHVTGDGLVRLSAYAIERPSQLGVTTADEVKLRFDFTVRRAGDNSLASLQNPQ